MKWICVLGLVALVAVWGFAEPVVDGKVVAGEYAHTQAVLDGSGTLNWSQDAQGGLSVALTAKTKGWAAVGFGAKRMSGSTIYLGFFGSDGKGVFSEQKAKGHGHSASGATATDKSVVTRTAGVTVVEFHLAAGQLPFTGKSVPFIVAFGPSADLVSFHEDNFDTGTLALP
jgi:hypothetical protein